MAAIKDLGWLNPGANALLSNPGPNFGDLMRGAIPVPPSMSPASYRSENLNVLQRLFGTPSNEGPANFQRRENVSITDLETQYANRFIPFFRSVLTYKVACAMGASLITQGATIRITDEHNIHFTQTSAKVLPAQPIGPMSKARFSTRSAIEYILQSHRSAAGAYARMEILRDPLKGEQERAFMLDSIAAGIIYEMQQCILGAAVAGWHLRYWLSTNGERRNKFVNIDRQMIDEARNFGAFNKSTQSALNVINNALGEVKAPVGSHLVWLPYSARDAITGLPSHMDPVRQAAEVQISQAAAEKIGFIWDRKQIFAAAPEPDEAMVIERVNGRPLFFIAPPSTMDPADHSLPGILNSYVTIANFFRSPSFGFNGMKKRYSGKMRLYDGTYDHTTDFNPGACLEMTGWWDKYYTASHGSAGQYPTELYGPGPWSKAARTYLQTIETKRKSPPKNHPSWSKLIEARSVADNYMSYADALDTAYKHPFVTCWHDPAKPAETFRHEFAREAIDMYIPDFPHSTSLRGAKEFGVRVQELAHGLNLKPSQLTVADAFKELHLIIRELCDYAPVDSDLDQFDWTRHTIVKNPHDGVLEFAQNSKGGLTFNKASADTRLFGCISGPMLQAIVDTPSDMLSRNSFAELIRNRLINCLPVVRSALEAAQKISPQSALYAGNIVDNVFRQNGNADPLTAYIANTYSTTPVFVKVTGGNVDSVKDREQPPADVDDLKSKFFVGEEFVFSDNATIMPNYNARMKIVVDGYKDSISAVNATLRQKYRVNRAGQNLNLKELFAYYSQAEGAEALGLKTILDQLGTDAAEYSGIADKNVLSALLALRLSYLACNLYDGAGQQSATAMEKLPEFANLLKNAILPTKVNAVGKVTGSNWVRTPLVFPARQLQGSVNYSELAIAPGDITNGYRTPVALLDNLPMYVDGTVGKRDFSVQAVHEELKRFKTAVDTEKSFDPFATAARAGFFGGMPSKKGPLVREMISAPVFQQALPDNLIKLRQFRYQLYEMTNPNASPFEYFCWRAYMHTPLTPFSLSNFYDENTGYGVQPFVDVGAMKWSQIFLAADMLVMRRGAVTVHMAPLSTYLVFSNSSKMVAAQTEKKSIEFLENPEDVYVAQSVYVESCIGGRGNAAIRPDHAYEAEHWAGRGNGENLLVVFEKVTNTWTGCMSASNMLTETQMQIARRDNRIYFSPWSSQQFCEFAFRNLWDAGRDAYSEKYRSAQNVSPNPQQMLQNFEAAMDTKQTPLLMAPYCFQGYQWEIDDTTKTFSKQVPGDQLSPLGEAYWNKSGLLSRLNRKLQDSDAFSTTMLST